MGLISTACKWREDNLLVLKWFLLLLHPFRPYMLFEALYQQHIVIKLAQDRKIT
ncbi:hypothetical protein Hanom_Chr15g01350241 [Helianthus anomalus]